MIVNDDGTLSSYNNNSYENSYAIPQEDIEDEAKLSTTIVIKKHKRTSRKKKRRIIISDAQNLDKTVYLTFDDGPLNGTQNVISILEESTKAYLEERYDLIPTLRLLFTDIETLRERAGQMRQRIGTGQCEVVESSTFMGGGTLPNREFPTIALQLKGKATTLERAFRRRGIIGRIEKDAFLIDFRALEPHDEKAIVAAAAEVLA